MPELNIDRTGTRIELSLPVNTIAEIRAVSEIVREIYTQLPNYRCSYSVYHSNRAVLHTNQRNAFEEYYIDGQGFVIDKLAVVWIDTRRSIESDTLRTDLQRVRAIVEREYQKAQRPLSHFAMSAQPLNRIS